MTRFLAMGLLSAAALATACRQAPSTVPALAARGNVSVPGAQLYYEMFGQGDPIIVVPGGPGLDHTYLLPGMRALARSHLVVFYDPRGSGRTLGEVDGSTVSFDRLLSDIDALADTLHLGRVSLLGHSWGGLVAMRYAARHPERLRCLILMNTVEPGQRYAAQLVPQLRARQSPADSAQLATLMQSDALRSGDATAVSAMMRTLFRASFADTARAKELVLDLDQRTASNMFKFAALVMGPLGPSFDLWPEVRTIRVPTLLVQGVDDLVPREMARTLAGAISGATLVEIEHAGHFPYIERPTDTFAAIDRFLHSVSLAEPPLVRDGYRLSKVGTEGRLTSDSRAPLP